LAIGSLLGLNDAVLLAGEKRNASDQLRYSKISMAGAENDATT